MLRYTTEFVELKTAFDESGSAAVAECFDAHYKIRSDRATYTTCLKELATSLSPQQAIDVLNHVISTLQTSAPRTKHTELYKLYIDIIKNSFHQSDTDFIHLIRESNHLELIIDWMNTLTISQYSKLKTLLHLPENITITDKLLKLAFEKNRFRFIMYIATNDLIDQSVLAEKYPELYNAYLDVNTITDLEYRHFAIQRLSEFYNEFGNITADGVLLTLASLHDDKKISPATLVVEYEENAYFSYFRYIPPPFTERFIYRDSVHSMACEAHVDATGHLQLFILDSLGLDVNSSGTVTKLHFGGELAKAALNIDKNAELYFPQQKRQHSAFGCLEFALDDIRHLESMARYIDPIKYPNGLFDYLSKNSETITIKRIPIKRAIIPLRLMRTQQSSALLKLMESSDEAHLPLNKKGITGHQFAKEKPGFFNNAEGKPINKRLDKKLNNIARRNLNFILRHNQYEFMKKMAEFSLDAFKKRIDEKTKTSDRKLKK
jgi:hypothetical protein